MTTENPTRSGNDEYKGGKPPFTELSIPQGQGNLYTRDYKGVGPAFVLMHGFPDNLHIYDDLVPYLAAAGRRVVAFDFLGFGASDKPSNAVYDFQQQIGDLEAVVEARGLGRIVPVAHDSSGPAAINFTLAHPERVESLCILNSGYDDRLPIHWPEMVALFATGSLNALSKAVAQSPQQFGWLPGWQKKQFSDLLPEGQRARFETGVVQLIADNFIRQPSSGPAFAQLASHFFEELARNTRRLPEVGALEIPVKVIWGEFDPYITVDVAKDRASHFKRVALYVLPGGHWVQSDLPEQVAREMLS